MTRNNLPFLCFIHIERAGGTTIHHILRKNYPYFVTLSPRFYWTNNPEAVFTPKQLKLLTKFFPFAQGIGGHTVRANDNYKNVLNKNIFFFTFLRNPVYRYISHLNYQKQKMNIDWDIQDFLNDKRFNNYMTVRIAGEANLELAKKRLKEDFDFIGITEKFELSMWYFKHLLGDKKFNPVQKTKNAIEKNKNIYNFETLPKEIQQKIKENNKLDMELYQYALNNIFLEYEKFFPYTPEKKSLSLNKRHFSRLSEYKIKIIKLFTRYFIEPIVYKF